MPLTEWPTGERRGISLLNGATAFAGPLLIKRSLDPLQLVIPARGLSLHFRELHAEITSAVKDLPAQELDELLPIGKTYRLQFEQTSSAETLTTMTATLSERFHAGSRLELIFLWE